jgi:hypothetical protein
MELMFRGEGVGSTLPLSVKSLTDGGNLFKPKWNKTRREK